MKKIRICFIAFCTFWCIACSEEQKIGEIASLTPDYVLPQGKSPADGRIVELHNRYGTYILYEYTKLDFRYELSDSIYKLPDPRHVGDMLDLLEDIWFRFYPVEFHKKYMPYKLFLSESLKQVQFNGSIHVMYVLGGENSLALSYCSDTLRKMSAATKLEYKNELQKRLWYMWKNSSIIEFPQEFFEVSDYSRAADGYNVSSPNYARARGFVANNGSEWSSRVDWLTKVLDKQTDLSSFLIGMITRTSENWISDLSYPLVKKKYDILRNYFLEKHGFDIQKIGDATYR